MKYSELISMINREFTLIASNILNDSEIIDVLLLDQGIETYRNDTLYIGHLSQLNDCRAMPPNFFYYSELPDDLQFKKYNCAEIRPEDFPAVFNLVKNELMNALRTENEYVGMLKMILDGKSLSAILDAAAQRIQNAFVVLDISGKLLAHSTPFNISDPLWIQSVADGYCSYEFMSHIKQLRFKKVSPKTTEAFVAVCDENNMTYLCSKILSGSNLLGYVFMFDNEAPIDEQSREILPAISRAACELITRAQETPDLRTNLYYSIMSDMLAGIDEEHVNVRIQVSELKFPERMRVLNVRPSYYRGEHYITGHLLKTMEGMVNNPPPICHNGGIVCIVPLDEARQVQPDLMKKLSLLAVDEHLLIGISNGFTQISHLATYYAQSEDALKFALRINVEGNSFYYHDFAFWSLLSSLPNGLNIRRYCHPALDLLRKYDFENGTALYQTLKAYIEAGLNQHNTAEQLFLHRNSLSYRLKRIKELTSLDFKEADLLFQLMYSFKLEEFCENEL